MASQPRINSTLVVAIRMAKLSKSSVSGGPQKAYHFVHNQNRPDKAYTTDRAQKKGKANAASGKIFVTIPSDHFGPIPAENDPERNQGVLVGECWEDRLECRQWGAHFPHIAGIAGQSNNGAQSVVLSGGYQDDEDHGEWFLYTGRFFFLYSIYALHSLSILDVGQQSVLVCLLFIKLSTHCFVSFPHLARLFSCLILASKERFGTG